MLGIKSWREIITLNFNLIFLIFILTFKYIYIYVGLIKGLKALVSNLLSFTNAETRSDR